MKQLDWLLDSDPTLRWQVEKDLQEADPSVWQATKERMAAEGFVKQILAHQETDGTWQHGAHFPKDYAFDQPGQPFTSTGPVLKQFQEWGVPASALRPNTSQLLEDLRWEYDDLPFWAGEVDVCINAYTLSAGLWLGRDMTHLIDWFLEHQLPDGGWNCEWVDGSTVSSFHSTLNALFALLEAEQTLGKDDRASSRKTARWEYLLSRRLMYGLHSGERLPFAVHYAYPFRFAYSHVRALDYFRRKSLFDGTKADPRLQEAINVLKADANEQGRWMTDHHHIGADYVVVDSPIGEESKWLTFYALRILKWWNH